MLLVVVVTGSDPVTWLGCMVDVSEEELLRRAATTDARIVSTLLDDAPIAFACIDTELRFVYVNKELLRAGRGPLLGVTDGAEYEAATAELAPRATLVLGTDGRSSCEASHCALGCSGCSTRSPARQPTRVRAGWSISPSPGASTASARPTTLCARHQPGPRPRRGVERLDRLLIGALPGAPTRPGVASRGSAGARRERWRTT